MAEGGGDLDVMEVGDEEEDSGNYFTSLDTFILVGGGFFLLRLKIC